MKNNINSTYESFKKLIESLNNDKKNIEDQISYTKGEISSLKKQLKFKKRALKNEKIKLRKNNKVLFVEFCLINQIAEFEANDEKSAKQLKVRLVPEDYDG